VKSDPEGVGSVNHDNQLEPVHTKFFLASYTVCGGEGARARSVIVTVVLTRGETLLSWRLA
jgi:hypothetical protein